MIGLLSDRKRAGFVLTAAALAWVCLMSLTTGAGRGPAAGSIPRDDGSVKAVITRLDNRDFHIGLSVRVDGADGKVLGGLGSTEFEVAEDGHPVVLQDFTTAGQQALDVCLLIDRSGSMAREDRLGGAKRAALAFLDMARNGVDRIGLISFSDRADTILEDGLLDPQRRDRARDGIEALSPDQGTALFDSIETALDGMREASGRRVLLALTDGIDNSRAGSITTRGTVGALPVERIKSITDKANALSVPLYMIGLGPESDIDTESMELLAQQSGGKYYHAPSAERLAELYRGIGQSLQNEYSFSYDSPTPELDGLKRDVTVIVRRGGVGTVASRGYAVGGVLSSGTTRKRAPDAAKGGAPDPSDESSAPPFLIVLTPLLLLLGLLFAVPYARLVMNAGSAVVTADPAATAPPPTTAAVVPPFRAPTLGTNPPATAAVPPFRAPAPSTNPRPPTPTTRPAAAPVRPGTSNAPKPAAPVSASPPKPSDPAPKPAAGGCPGCGRSHPGPVGARYCMICDMNY